MFQTIEYDMDPERMLATVRLNRPAKRNALNGMLIEEFVQAINDAENDDEVRVIVITGAGGHFSAGYDLQSGSNTTGTPTVDESLDKYERITDHVHAVWNCNKPVIAAVEGYCLAGGSDLAMACDIVLAVEGAEFGYPGIRMGGVPPTLIYPFVMHLHHTKELLLSGKRITATRAAEIGMVNRVVPTNELEAAIEEEASEIRKVPGNNVRILKHIINGIAESQGAQPMFKYSELFDALAHHTEYGRRFYEVSEEEDFEGVLKYLNEEDKGMEPPSRE